MELNGHGWVRATRCGLFRPYLSGTRLGSDSDHHLLQPNVRAPGDLAHLSGGCRLLPIVVR